MALLLVSQSPSNLSAASNNASKKALNAANTSKFQDVGVGRRGSWLSVVAGLVCYARKRRSLIYTDICGSCPSRRTSDLSALTPYPSLAAYLLLSRSGHQELLSIHPSFLYQIASTAMCTSPEGNQNCTVSLLSRHTALGSKALGRSALDLTSSYSFMSDGQLYTGRFLGTFFAVPRLQKSRLLGSFTGERVTECSCWHRLLCKRHAA